MSSNLIAEEYAPVQIGISEPKLKSIEEFFAGNLRFAVPRYQRNFSWTSEETQELWEDVTSAMDRGGEFFLGTVVLHSKPLPEPQEIIDGQQRIACITMLFSAIRNVFRASHDDERATKLEVAFLGSKGYSRDAISTPKLLLNEINNPTFEQYVIASEDEAKVAERLRDKSVKLSNRNLLLAYQFFLNKVTVEAAKLGTQSDTFIVPLIDTLRTKVKLITIPVMSDEDANLFFESLNARGKELAISDLVKNRLYFDAGEHVNTAEQGWGEMDSHLGRRPIPEFLRHYWIAKKMAKDSPMVREKHLYRMIRASVAGKPDEKTSEEAKRVARAKTALELIKDFKVGAADYARISDHTLWPDDSPYDESFKQSLEDLRFFKVTQTHPLLLNVIQNFSAASEVAKTFRFVANFAFRYYIIGGQSSGVIERLSADIAYNIREQIYTSASDVADQLRAANPDQTFRSVFKLAVFPEKSAKMAKYALAKITNHLKKIAGGAEAMVDPNDKLTNLEHVLPQAVPSAWLSDFSRDVDPQDYVYRIGNLTLLNAKINRNAADKSFTKKKALALDGSSLKINAVFKTLSSWGDHEIEQRQDSLAKTALEVWKL
jgi:uncharacterized protein with ParB-like and HNH nuclease domain